MKKSILAIALTLFVSGLAGASSLGGFRIKAPQPFTVGGTAMPAGVYDIQVVSPAGVLEIANATTHLTAMVIGTPISTVLGTQPGRVTLAPVDGKLALTQVFLPNGEGFGVFTHSTAR